MAAGAGGRPAVPECHRLNSNQRCKVFPRKLPLYPKGRSVLTGVATSRPGVGRARVALRADAGPGRAFSPPSFPRALLSEDSADPHTS